MSPSLVRSTAILGILLWASSTLKAQVSTSHAQSCPAMVSDSTTVSIDQPKRLTGPAPRYPEVLRRRGVTGEVRLQFVIGCDGRVDSTTVVISSTTDSLFTGSAIASVVGTEFSPAMLNGRAVAYRMELAIRFRLSTGP